MTKDPVDLALCVCAQELIDHVVAVAENTADELARSDGREVQLQEDPDLQLPFLLPEDGYSCDVVRSLPNGLQDFLEPLLQRGDLSLKINLICPTFHVTQLILGFMQECAVFYSSYVYTNVGLT